MPSAFYGGWKSGMMAGCEHLDASGTPIVSLASGPLQRYRACSVTRRPASSTCAGEGKNGMRRVRDLPCGGTQIYLDLEIRRVHCTRCGTVKQE